MDYMVLFDGICNLCNGAVRFIATHDRMKRFRFATLQSDTGKQLLQKAGLPDEKIHTIIYIKGNKHYQRSTAILNIMKDMGGIWRFFYGFIIIPPFIRDFFYNIVAKTRYRIFGKKDQC